MEKIKIIICDDHPLILEGLQRMIREKTHMEIVAAVQDLKSLFEIIPKVQTDIILLDINLPDGNGIDACLQIKKFNPNIKILTLSNLHDRSIILRMLKNGASGYLLKSVPVKEIETAIEIIYHGGVYFGTHVQQILTSFKLSDLDEIPPVTKREKEILKLLGEGLTSQEIGEKLFISPLTVETHRKNLMQKFKVNKTINLIQLAKENKFI